MLTSAQTDRLFELSQMNPVQLGEMLSGNVSNILPKTDILKSDNIANNNEINVNITVPNITNKDEFNDYLRDSGTVRYIRGVVSDGMLGKNSYNRFRY